MNKPKATVIIPYYKKKDTIKRAIKSVILQTYKNLELILIYDDQDNSDLKFLKNLKKLDKRIRIIVNKKNLGAGRSRNIGIFNSKGKYICFLDADDYWKKNKLSFQIDFMISKNSDISHTTYEIRDFKNNIISLRIAKDFNDLRELLPSCDIGLSTVIAKKKIFNKKLKFSKLKTKEDFVLWLNFLKRGIKIMGINKNLATWNMTKNSLSSSSTQKIKDAFIVYSKYMNFNYFKSFYFTLILSLNIVIKYFFDK